MLCLPHPLPPGTGSSANASSLPQRPRGPSRLKHLRWPERHQQQLLNPPIQDPFSCMDLKWTLNQVGSVGTCEHLSWIITGNCLSANRTGRKTGGKTGRKTGRDSEWQGENVERRLIISYQEPVHASEVIITTCSLSISMMNYLKKNKTVLTSWFICPSILSQWSWKL